MGKVHPAAMATAHPRVPRRVLGGLAAHSVDWWLISEDLPRPDNRVLLGPGEESPSTGTPSTPVPTGVWCVKGRG